MINEIFLKKRKKTLILLSFCFIMVLSFSMMSVLSAADYYVDSNTKHSDITKWMKNDARKGDNLIFTGAQYNLTDTLIVSKSINIKSENKTKIYFNTINWYMFEVRASGVTFDGLSINYNAKNDNGNFVAVIHGSSGEKQIINIKNTDITVNSPEVDAIKMFNWQGNVTNCKINMIQGSRILEVNVWNGNIVNSKMTSKNADGLFIWTYWKGNIVNSEISSNSVSSLFATNWKGKITNSNLSSIGSLGKSYGVFLPDSAGTISNSTIKVQRGYAIGVSDEVKVSKCSLSSGKKSPNIYRFRSDLAIYSVKKSGNAYKIHYANPSETTAKPCHIVIKVRNKILKKVAIKKTLMQAQGYNPYGTTIKVTIPSKYANKKYTKTAIIDYYKVNKEYDRKNNLYKFKF